MIDLYYEATPNGRKALMALEELGLEYRVQWVDIRSGEQNSPEFRRVNPNGKIPAIVDHDGPEGEPLAVFESAAILLYLADKTGCLLPTGRRERWEAVEWTIWQAANQGPATGNAAHFVLYAPSAGVDISYAKERYRTEVRRCAAVLDRQLIGREYIAGEFSIADLQCYPWSRVLAAYDIDVHDFPHLKAWGERISHRPSANVELTRPDGVVPPRIEDFTPEQFKTLFGVDPTKGETA